MSWTAIAGASLLAVATIPQAIRLVRTREAGDFGWSFTVLNLLGLALLAARSWIIGEWAFLAINVVTTTFWGLVIVVKAMGTRGSDCTDPSVSFAPAEPDPRSP